MSPAQRAKLDEAELQCALEIPSILMRTTLIKFMIDKFDTKTNKFYVQEGHDGITVCGVDVECIFSLRDSGLDMSAILYQEGEDAELNVSETFLSKATDNIVIDELIADVIKSKVADDDFLRKTVLILLGTVLAPQSHTTIPKPYYALVQYVQRVKKLNFNEFTLCFLLDSLKQIGTGLEKRQWPTGNVALLQV
jgi:hypothetical protein